MRDKLGTAATVGLVMLAWPVWMIVCAPLIATLCHAAFSVHHTVGAVAGVLAPIVPGAGTAVYAVRVANVAGSVASRTELCPAGSGRD